MVVSTSFWSFNKKKKSQLFDPFLLSNRDFGYFIPIILCFHLLGSGIRWIQFIVVRYIVVIRRQMT